MSRTLTAPDWNNTTLQAGEGGPIVAQGSTTLVHALLDDDLVDELRLMVFPVTVGTGGRVFPESSKKTSWRATGSRAFVSQVREDTYRRLA